MLLGPSLAPSFPRVVLAPTLAGLVVAVLAIRVFPLVRTSGVNQIKSAVYISNGYVPFVTVIGKFIACALAIGSGQSLGPEDPSLQMGAGIASLIGRSLRLSQEKVRLIAPVGAAAGLAAAFNAPISAVLFVIEEVIGTWSAGVLGAIVLAAVSSVVTMRAFLGPESLFRVPPFRVAGPSEMLAYAVLGVAGGGASLLLLKWIAWARPKVQALPNWTKYLLAFLGGIADRIDRDALSAGDGRGLCDCGPGDARAIRVAIAVVAGRAKIAGDRIFFSERNAGRDVCACAIYRRDVGRSGWRHGASFRAEPYGDGGHFCAGGNGDIVCGVSAHADHFGIYGDRGCGKLHCYFAGNYFHDDCVWDFARLPEGPFFDVLARQDGVALPSIEERREMTSFVVEDAMRTDGVLVSEPGEHIVEVAEARGRRTRRRRCCCACVRENGGCWTAKTCCGWRRTQRAPPPLSMPSPRDRFPTFSAIRAWPKLCK